MKLPTNAIIAVTLNCNSRCRMCRIWKNHFRHELSASEYLKLPSSLTDINITGGEPFLRPDLPDIIKNIKKACPRARLVLNSNGFLPQVIDQQIPQILQIDANFAVRLSLDGWEKTHNSIRQIPHGFSSVIKSLGILKKHGVKDLGISFTIMETNYRQIYRIYQFCQKENIQFTPTLISDSPIYFGKNSLDLYPKNNSRLKTTVGKILTQRFKSSHPKDWFRGWFETELVKYHQTKRRPLACDAGQNFFYLDSVGNIYPCHILDQPLGNICRESFNQIWFSGNSRKIADKCRQCNQCWMICTAKTAIKHHLPSVAGQMLYSKFIRA